MAANRFPETLHIRTLRTPLTTIFGFIHRENENPFNIILEYIAGFLCSYLF